MPIPWPTNSRTTEYPWLSAWVCTACPMSPTRLPGWQTSMPARSDSRVTFMSRFASSLVGPTATVRAASPKKPSTMHPRSRPTMSPSRSFRGPGIPCTTSSLTEMHRVAG